MPKTDLNNTKSIKRVFKIIEYLAECKTEVSLLEITNGLKFPKSTTHRLINDLKELGYVDQDPSKKYYLSYEFLRIGNKIMNKNDFIDKMIPYMNFFAKKYHFDIGLSGFYKKNVIHLHSVYNGLSFVLNLTSGSVQPAYCTATGKVFLANLSKEQFDKYLLKTNLIPFTDHTIIDKDRLIEEINITRTNGFGIANSEFIQNLCCIALPLRDTFNRIIGTMNFTTTSDKYGLLTNKELIQEVKDVLSGVIDV